MPWTTAFTTPTALTGLTATADASTSSVVLEWDETVLTTAIFWRYYIFRDGIDGEPVLIGEVDDKTTPTFTDASAPHGRTLVYRVTVSNGWAQSDAAIVTASLGLAWWLVTPTDPAVTFEFPPVTGYSESNPYPQETYAPLGRTSHVVVAGELLPATGQLSMRLFHPDHAGIYERILRAAVAPLVYLKTPTGEVRAVKLGSISRTAGPHATFEVSIAFTSVA